MDQSGAVQGAETDGSLGVDTGKEGFIQVKEEYLIMHNQLHMCQKGDGSIYNIFYLTRL